MASVVRGQLSVAEESMSMGQIIMTRGHGDTARRRSGDIADCETGNPPVGWESEGQLRIAEFLADR
jgi:hypothetical protein